MGILQKILEVQRRIILGENMAFFYILPLILMGAIGGSAQESYQTAYYGNEAVNQSPNNPLANAFGVRQDSISPADGVMAAAIAGAFNVGLTLYSTGTVKGKTKEVCNKVNEVLNVATLGGTTDDSIATFAYTNGISGTSTGTTVTLKPGSGGSLTSTSGLAAS